VRVGTVCGQECSGSKSKRGGVPGGERATQRVEVLGGWGWCSKQVMGARCRTRQRVTESISQAVYAATCYAAWQMSCCCEACKNTAVGHCNRLHSRVTWLMKLRFASSQGVEHCMLSS
jgi:hypothetical protein